MNKKVMYFIVFVIVLIFAFNLPVLLFHLEDIDVNIWSDLFFFIIPIGVAWLAYKYSDRRKLLEFFAIEKTKTIAIYVSNILVKEGGAIGVDGNPLEYTGISVAFGELEGARWLEGLFRYFIPSFTELSGIFRKILIADIKVIIDASPKDNSSILDQANTIISIGSSAFNFVSKLIEKEPLSKANFYLGKKYISDNIYQIGAIGVAFPEFNPVITLPDANDNFNRHTGQYVVPSGIIMTSSSGSAIYPQSTRGQEEDIPNSIRIKNLPDIQEKNRSFIERLFDPDKNRSLFYIAGLSENATRGATYYLTKYWKDLDRTHPKNKDFLIILQTDQTNYEETRQVFEVIL